MLNEEADLAAARASAAHTRLRLFSRGAGASVWGIGALVLLGGWVLGIEALRGLVPGAAPMPAHSALALLAAGAALCLLQEPVATRWKRAGNVCAAVSTLIGLTLLVEYGA